MKLGKILPALPLLAALSVSAAEVKLPELRVDAKIYTNVTIFGANATDLYFSHAQGLANVKLKYLAPDVQKRFGYDPAQAAVAEQQQADDEQRYAEALANAISTEVVTRLRATKTPTGESLADAVSDKSLLNRPLPELTVDKWLTEKPALKNKWVIVFFWTSQSAACRRVIPDLNNWQKKFADQLVIVGIALEGESTLSQLTGSPVEFASATDSTSALGGQCGVTSVPTIVLADPQSIIRYQGHPAAVNERELRKLMASLPGQ
jgi:thiol-disulfide isomerase/thioredoxin